MIFSKKYTYYSVLKIVNPILPLVYLLCVPSSNLYGDNSMNWQFAREKIALILPVSHIAVQYRDNTSLPPDTLFNESFFIEAANTLLTFECQKYFSLYSDTAVGRKFTDSIKWLTTNQYSKVKTSIQNDMVSHYCKKYMKPHNIEYLILPVECEIVHSTIQEKGWRNSPSYQRPINRKAKATIRIQIWNKDGKLQYDRISIKKTREPFIVRFLKKKKRPHDTIISYSKSFIASPGIKSLAKAIAEAMDIGILK